MHHAGTHTGVQVVIIQTLLFMTSFTANLPHDASDALRNAAAEQDRIGILNFLVGKLSLQWSHIQDEHYKSSSKFSRKTGQRWAADLIERLCSYTFHTWKIRSEKVHEAITKEAEEEEARKLNEMIEAYFDSWNSQIRATDRLMFDVSKEELLSVDLDIKKEWLEMIQIFCTHAREIRMHEYHQMQRYMESWTAGRMRFRRT